jgi:hypothetical protein
MVRELVWSGALALALGLVGCGKSEGSGPVPRGELGSRLAAVVCESVASCCKNGGHPFDKAGCQSSFGAELDSNIAEISTTRVDYDAEAGGDCIDAIAATIQCGDLESAASVACERVFRGKVAAGQPCEDSNECQHADGEHSSCTGGVCTPRKAAPHGKAGEACAYTCDADDSSCSVYLEPTPVGSGEPPVPTVACYQADGLFCDSGSCQPLVALGGACADSSACKPGAFCDFDARVCASLKADGASCSSDSDCQSDNCANDNGSDAPSIEPVARHCAARNVASADTCSEDFDDDDDDASTPPPQTAP